MGRLNLSWWAACIGLSLLVAAALAVLLAVYVRAFRRSRAPFSLGLTVFAACLLVEALGSVAVWVGLAQEYGADVAIPMMLLRAVEMVGVGVLLAVSVG